MPLYTADVEMMSSEQRQKLASGLPRIEASTKPCECGSSDLRAWHQFGAMSLCASCGTRGLFRAGNNYQREEERAVWAWEDQPHVK